MSEIVSFTKRFLVLNADVSYLLHPSGDAAGPKGDSAASRNNHGWSQLCFKPVTNHRTRKQSKHKQFVEGSTRSRQISRNVHIAKALCDSWQNITCTIVQDSEYASAKNYLNTNTIAMGLMMSLEATTRK